MVSISLLKVDESSLAESPNWASIMCDQSLTHQNSLSFEKSLTALDQGCQSMEQEREHWECHFPKNPGTEAS